MRSPEELKAIRQKLSLRFGANVLFMSDTDVEAWGDAIENCYSGIKYQWDVRIMYTKDTGKDWRDIPVEKASPYATTKDVYEHGHNLVYSNQHILSLRANIVDSFDESVLITKQP